MSAAEQGAGQIMSDDRLSIDGAHVASITLPPARHLSRTTPATTLHLFHGRRWSLVRVPLPAGDSDRAMSEVRVSVFDNLAEVLDTLHGLWPLEPVVEQLLDAGRDIDEPDAELNALWRVSRYDRDFEGASIFNRDLSEGGLYGDPEPAIGRQLEGWADDALDAMATHLENQGYTILARAPGELDAGGLFGNPTVGKLTVVRYGYVVTGTVRVDAAGEIFIRADWLDRDDEDRGPGTDLQIRARELQPHQFGV